VSRWEKKGDKGGGAQRWEGGGGKKPEKRKRGGEKPRMGGTHIKKWGGVGGGGLWAQLPSLEVDLNQCMFLWGGKWEAVLGGGESRTRN